MSRAIRIDNEVARRLATLRRPDDRNYSVVILRLLDPARCPDCLGRGCRYCKGQGFLGDYPLPDTRMDAS